MNDEGATGYRAPHRTTLSRQWAAASEQAFAAVVDKPAVYQLTTRLVGALVEKLRKRCRDLNELEKAWEQRSELLAATLETDNRLSLEELDPATILGAAFAMVERSAAETSAADRRAVMLADSSTRGSWITLEESGYSAGDTFVPYRRLDAHTSSGAALLITTQPDETMADCIHAVQELGIDLSTGRLIAPQDTLPNPHTFDTERAREDFTASIMSL